MGRTLAASVLASLMSATAMAETIGVSMALFDDYFLTVLRNGMIEYAESLDGVEIQVEDAQNDVSKQLTQIRGFADTGMDAIIVNPVNTDATLAITQVALDAGIPMVYVNREPVNVDQLPDDQAFVASDERESGTLEAREICRLLKERGKGDGARILVMMGELSNQAAWMRTKDVHEVIATKECSFMEIADSQTAKWQRAEAEVLMTNWLSSGIRFDAVVSNNDEMAIGAIEAMKAAGISMEEMLVGGIDATQDALAAMAAGDLDVTVFQDAAGQGKGAVDAALALARGEDVDQKVYVPFQLVTPENIADFQQID
jgi:ABC-type sugar transport system substrate-binding protein